MRRSPRADAADAINPFGPRQALSSGDNVTGRSTNGE